MERTSIHTYLTEDDRAQGRRVAEALESELSAMIQDGPRLIGRDRHLGLVWSYWRVEYLDAEGDEREGVVTVTTRAGELNPDAQPLGATLTFADGDGERVELEVL
jgi:hypothetical protein